MPRGGRSGLTPEQWAQIEQVRELVTQEGDRVCAEALDWLAAEELRQCAGHVGWHRAYDEERVRCNRSWANADSWMESSMMWYGIAKTEAAEVVRIQRRVFVERDGDMVVLRLEFPGGKAAIIIRTFDELLRALADSARFNAPANRAEGEATS